MADQIIEQPVSIQGASGQHGFLQLNGRNEDRHKNPMCVIRLCRPTAVVFDGLTEVHEKKNKPPEYFLMTIKACELCGRTIREFWDEARREAWRKENAHLYEAAE